VLSTACLHCFLLTFCCLAAAAGSAARLASLQLGFTLSIYYLAVWVGCGLTVWRALGIW
jgi:hypothetical protein